MFKSVTFKIYLYLQLARIYLNRGIFLLSKIKLGVASNTNQIIDDRDN